MYIYTKLQYVKDISSTYYYRLRYCLSIIVSYVSPDGLGLFAYKY